MSLTTIIVELAWIAATVLYCLRAGSTSRLDRLRVVYAITAIVNLGICAVWVIFAAMRGQYPTFGLVPLALAGALTGIMALRANQLYAARGTSPE